MKKNKKHVFLQLLLLFLLSTIPLLFAVGCAGGSKCNLDLRNPIVHEKISEENVDAEILGIKSCNSCFGCNSCGGCLWSKGIVGVKLNSSAADSTPDTSTSNNTSDLKLYGLANYYTTNTGCGCSENGSDSILYASSPDTWFIGCDSTSLNSSCGIMNGCIYCGDSDDLKVQDSLDELLTY